MANFFWPLKFMQDASFEHLGRLLSASHIHFKCVSVASVAH
jgi:hypothetical protein